jgi:hypothetical protein
LVTKPNVYEVHISCADGAAIIYHTQTAKDALNWLTKMDHEGASTGLIVHFTDNEDIRGILEVLKKHGD